MWPHFEKCLRVTPEEAVTNFILLGKESTKLKKQKQFQAFKIWQIEITQVVPNIFPA